MKINAGFFFVEKQVIFAEEQNNASFFKTKNGFQSMLDKPVDFLWF